MPMKEMLFPDTENTLRVAQYTLTLFGLCFDFEVWWFFSHCFLDCECLSSEFGNVLYLN